MAGCGSTNANGPRFAEVPQSPVSTSQVRIYALRDKVFYAVQAAHIVKAQITVDGRVVGNLMNGGFLSVDVLAGRHNIAAASGSDETMKGFESLGGSEVYFEVWDKTRMQGARAAPAFFVGGYLGARVYGLIEGSLREEHEGRIWGLQVLSREEAQEKFSRLSLSE